MSGFVFVVQRASRAREQVLRLRSDDESERQVLLSLRAAEIRDWLNAKEASFLEAVGKSTDACTWHPECLSSAH